MICKINHFRSIHKRSLKMIYTDNRQEKLNVDEEFINSLEKVCDFVLKKRGSKL